MENMTKMRQRCHQRRKRKSARASDAFLTRLDFQCDVSGVKKMWLTLSNLSYSPSVTGGVIFLMSCKSWMQFLCCIHLNDYLSIYIYIYISMCVRMKSQSWSRTPAHVFLLFFFRVCALSHQESASCFCHYNSLELVNIVSVTSYFFLYSLVM